MENFSFIFDIIALAIVIISVAVSYKRGFLSSIILFLGYLASVLLSVFGGRYLSNSIYEKFIRSSIIDKVNVALGENPVIISIVDTVGEIIESFPSFIKADVYSRFSSSDGVADFLISKNVAAEQLGETIADEVVAPVVTGLLQTVCCLLIFVICVIIIRILASAFTNVDKIPLIGSVNKFFGGVLGLGQGAIILMIFCVAVELIIKITSNELSWLNYDLINRSYIFKLIYHKLIF